MARARSINFRLVTEAFEQLVEDGHPADSITPSQIRRIAGTGSLGVIDEILEHVRAYHLARHSEDSMEPIAKALAAAAMPMANAMHAVAQRQVVKTQDELRSAQNDLEATTKSLEAAQNERAAAERQNHALSETLRSERIKNQTTIDALRQDMQASTQQIESLKADLERAIQAKDESQAQFKGLIERIDLTQQQSSQEQGLRIRQLQDEAQAATAELSKAQSTIAGLNKLVGQLQGEAKEHLHTRTNLRTATNEVAELRAELQSCMAGRSAAEKEVTLMREALQSSAERQAQLERDLATDREAATAREERLNRHIRRLQRLVSRRKD